MQHHAGSLDNAWAVEYQVHLEIVCEHALTTYQVTPGLDKLNLYVFNPFFLFAAVSVSACVSHGSWPT